MLPRHRTPAASPPRGPSAQVQVQVQLHVRRLVLEHGTALGSTPVAELPQALQAALAQQLAGQEPPVNQRTPLDQLAGSVKAQVQPALARAAGDGSVA